MSTPYDQVPGVGAPARRALQDAGYPDLESLHGISYPDLLALHGVGARGLERLQAALISQGLSLIDAPASPATSTIVTRGHTGTSAKDIKTHPTAVSPIDFVDGLDSPRRVKDGHLLLELFARATDGAEAVMWGPSMIGYGQAHYRYATGREGDTFQIGFSPRKAKLSLYGLQGHPRSEELLGKLGKHATAVSCVYVNKPEDVDLGILEELVRHAWKESNHD
ncbi:hypothetical protein CATRI_00550 [Corynebacterium atrinae]|uniref:DUF1801 domain-containing protein n=1 Tax=Corynebacterium atrinae TaxID=1336740 RepID=UPI0025B33B63|nr:DUF1801 domain-containing protein [Corynebacterium atrinae]WJY62232.1 hypothetical protein CATRI_00550 [Corynebacterium atrinae]